MRTVACHRRSIQWRVVVAAVAAIVWLLPNVASAQIRRPPGGGLTVFVDINFEGQSMTVRTDVPDLQTTPFNDTISSMRMAAGEQWLVCEHVNYQGRCAVVAGPAADLTRGNWNDVISSVRRIERISAAASPEARAAGLALFSGEGFARARRVFAGAEPDLREARFNDAARSLRVAPDFLRPASAENRRPGRQSSGLP